jgi:mono/diheme cytochrome c family protein
MAVLKRIFSGFEMLNKKLVPAIALVLAANVAWGAPSTERGKYIVSIAGCNDCHTDGYAETGGQVPMEDWLLGSSFGWTGPWGTTYATNLRLSAPNKSEDEWIAYAKHLQAKPPMPWFSLHHMTDEDLRSVYRFIRSLGADGEAAPDALPPGQEPKGSHAVFP